MKDTVVTETQTVPVSTDVVEVPNTSEIPVQNEKQEEVPLETNSDETPEVQQHESNEPQIEVQLPEVDATSKLNKLTTLFEDAGVSMIDVAKIAKENNGNIDTATLAKLVDKHGEAVATLLSDQVTNLYNSKVKEAESRDNAVYDQVKEAFEGVTEQSGAETWKELSTWAQTNISVENQTDLNKLLAQGGLAAKLAVQELVTAFKESQGTSEYQDAKLLTPDNLGRDTGALISKFEYNTKLNELLSKGHVYGESQEIARLDAQRQRSIARGI